MSRNCLFALKLNYDEPSCHASMIINDNWLCHMIFGHLNFGRIKYLTSKNLVTDLPFINVLDKVCDSCVLDEKYKHVFPKTQAWRASRSLELVHSYLCSMEVPSNGGNKYLSLLLMIIVEKGMAVFFGV